MRFKWLSIGSVCFLWIVLASLSMAQNSEFVAGDQGYLCLKRTLHPTWPELFAIQVEVIEVLNRRYRVKVLNEFPMPGRTNEEEVPVEGDVLKISKGRVYSKAKADVGPGERFAGKPVCHRLMRLDRP